MLLHSKKMSCLDSATMLICIVHYFISPTSHGVETVQDAEMPAQGILAAAPLFPSFYQAQAKYRGKGTIP